MIEGKAGDKVQLKDTTGGFTDSETGFDISRDQIVELSDPIGKRTQQAITSGGLIIVTGKATKSKDAGEAADTSDLPEDLPGRKVFVAAGLSLEQVKALDLNGLIALDGIAEKTAETVLKYFDPME